MFEKKNKNKSALLRICLLDLVPCIIYTSSSISKETPIFVYSNYIKIRH